jgi:hypothetical protein
MIGSIDYPGIAAVIAACTGLVTALGVIVLGVIQRDARSTAHAIHDEIQTGNSRTIGEAASATVEVIAPHADEVPPHAS